MGEVVGRLCLGSLQVHQSVCEAALLMSSSSGHVLMRDWGGSWFVVAVCAPPSRVPNRGATPLSLVPHQYLSVACRFFHTSIAIRPPKVLEPQLALSCSALPPAVMSKAEVVTGRERRPSMSAPLHDLQGPVGPGFSRPKHKRTVTGLAPSEIKSYEESIPEPQREA